MEAFALALLLLGQAPAVAPDTEVRALTATVMDKDGQAVEGLAEEDVAITENGVVRDITSFRPDDRLLTVAVIVDTSLTVRTDYRLNMVEAVQSFVSRLPEGTSYAIWTTGDRPTKLLDYTEDRSEASDWMLKVAPQGGNYMIDALAEASEDLKKNGREGDRLAVVALSSTGPELSYRNRWQAADQAEANADLFLLVQVDVGGAGFEERSKLSYVLDRLATASGGAYEMVLSFLGADAGLRNVSPYLTAGYRVAFATVPNLKKREIGLTVARPGSKVLLPKKTDIEAELEPEI